MDYEDPEMIAARHIYEMTISVFDDPRPSHTGKLDQFFKEHLVGHLL